MIRRPFGMRLDQQRKGASGALSLRLRTDLGSGDDCDPRSRRWSRRALRGPLRSDAQHRKGVLSGVGGEQVSGKGKVKFKIQNSIRQPSEKKRVRAIDTQWAPHTPWST